MSEFKGTKGKWFNNELSIISEENKKVIGGCYLMSFKHDTRGRLLPDTIGLFNAKLIATAPEMLEMLNNLLSMYINTDKPSVRMILEVQELLKKATE